MPNQLRIVAKFELIRALASRQLQGQEAGGSWFDAEEIRTIAKNILSPLGTPEEDAVVEDRVRTVGWMALGAHRHKQVEGFEVDSLNMSTLFYD